MNTSQTALFRGLFFSLSIHGLLLLTPLMPRQSEHQNQAKEVLFATIAQQIPTKKRGSELIKSAQSIKKERPSPKNRLPEREPPPFTPSHPESVYYAPDQVTQTAEIVQHPELPAPRLEGSQRGEIRLKVLINEFGVADLVEVEAMTSPSGYGEEVASKYRNTRYQAATISSKRVKSWLIVEIRYGE